MWERKIAVLWEGETVWPCCGMTVSINISIPCISEVNSKICVRV